VGLRLGRRLGESIIFRTQDGEVKVTVLGLRTLLDGVNLEIEAPTTIRILRAELESKAHMNRRQTPNESDGSGKRAS
jgi:sRNA-binding carbon storage regulator CsrA